MSPAPLRQRCPTCDGNGSVSPYHCPDDQFEPCPRCNGATTIEVRIPDDIPGTGLPARHDLAEEIIAMELAALAADDYGPAAAHSLYAESVHCNAALPPMYDPWWQQP